MKPDIKTRLLASIIQSPNSGPLLGSGSRSPLSAKRIGWAVTILITATGLLMLLAKRFGIFF